ncbi:MAG: hypothetical protein JW726_04870, partial [Anaerolineales bacterium]|nr:hypothetical protein [Anaerolineales bacterium]
HGVEFWQSDGTEGGTLLVKDINPGTEYSSPTDYLAVGHLLYFDAVDDTHGNELWAYQIAIPNSSPNTPSNPSPADGAVNISLTPTLSWTGGDADGDSVQYTVYGQKASDVISVVWCAASSSTSCAPSIVLEESTKYLWFVHADDGEGGQVDGPFWEFTTVGGASISYTVYLPMTTK